MFALAFRFPAGRYHATPWGRNVNEADVAWPPEPWRLLRTLIAAYWRKGDHVRWSQDDLARLIDTLAETLPDYRLPDGAIHAHTRHYMPTGTLEKGREKTTLVFDAFVHLPREERIVAAWPAVTLDADLSAFASDLATSIGYLGRAESWAECQAIAEWNDDPNCRPLDTGSHNGDRVRLLAPLPPAAYAIERQRLIAEVEERIRSNARQRLLPSRLDSMVAKAFLSKGRKADTLPARLVDALSLDTSDYQDRGWSRPPAAREVVYTRASEAAPGVVPRRIRRRPMQTMPDTPTVARFLLAGRPRPRVEDTVRIGELMRRAALAQFGWRTDDATGRRLPCAPWQISGRSADGRPLRDPAHAHAFWLPEDADDDGWIDHVSVFIAGGIDDTVRARLDRITRLWIASKRQVEGDAEDAPAAAKEWRLALEGFGRPADFAAGARIFGRSSRWRSVTPFLAAGHLKAAGYPGEVHRLVRGRGMETRFGFAAAEVSVEHKPDIPVGGTPRRPTHFHRFRSRGREAQPDAGGAFLTIRFPRPVEGPLALGYGSHFGLGLFVPDGNDGTDV